MKELPQQGNRVRLLSRKGTFAMSMRDLNVGGSADRGVSVLIVEVPTVLTAVGKPARRVKCQAGE